MTMSERDIRIEKLDKIRESGVNPYPSTSERTHNCQEVVDGYDTLHKDGTIVTIAGRIMLMRPHGGLTFMTLQDDSGKCQAMFRKNDIGNDKYKFLKNVDMADFVQVTGKLITTKTGEVTVEGEDYKLLSKALRPLPEKWHGIKDVEERYRKRYLDILMNPEVKDMVRKKSIFWQSIRDFMIQKGFLEIETPVLENTAGGADAKPFETHHNALDLDVYLRISAGELWQKKLMVAGFEKVFEIGRIFRNEGIDPEHLQDYTQMEFYWAYANYEAGMQLVKELYRHIAQTTFGTQKFSIRGFDVDLSDEWEIYDYREQILKHTGIDIDNTDVSEMKKKLDELKVKYEKSLNKGRAMDYLWKQVRKKLGGPGFLVNLPIEVVPLAKRNESKEGYVEIFQPIIAGSEVGKGYSELNDPIDQAQRFDEQAKLREAGDEEAQMKDDSFIEALEHGMPPTCGFGVSERFFAFLMDKSIRETVTFPLLRPRAHDEEE